MWSASFLLHMNHVSISPTNGMDPHKDREKLWPGWELNPRPSGSITAAQPSDLDLIGKIENAPATSHPNKENFKLKKPSSEQELNA